MSVSKLAGGGVAALLLRWARGLRFPWLFLLTFSLFLLNLVIPDVLPLVDELLMGLVALTVASLRRREEVADEPEHMPKLDSDSPDG